MSPHPSSFFPYSDENDRIVIVLIITVRPYPPPKKKSHKGLLFPHPHYMLSKGFDLKNESSLSLNLGSAVENELLMLSVSLQQLQTNLWIYVLCLSLKGFARDWIQWLQKYRKLFSFRRWNRISIACIVVVWR